MAYYDHNSVSFETIYLTDSECKEFNEQYEDDNYTAGFYWWFTLPGCMPDSDPYGPFESDTEAIVDAESVIETYYS